MKMNEMTSLLKHLLDGFGNCNVSNQLSRKLYLGVHSNWLYFAEGGRHIICRKKSYSNEYSCKYLLRLRKIDSDTDYDDDDDDSIKRIMKNIRCTDSIINSWFDISMNDFIINRVLALPPSFMSLLMMTIDDDRPIGRKSTNTGIYKYGTIEIDYSYLYKPVHINIINVNSNDISIELKVKCGLKCNSPFLACDNDADSSHDIKLRYSRYSLMQLVKLTKSIKNVTNPWETSNRSNFKLSLYNPSDICSRDVSKVSRAIISLISNPQNNFRVLKNGQHVYGWNKSTVDDFHKLQDVVKYFDDIDIGDDNSNFVTILGIILSEEKVLHRLELLQCLDIIDIEGAYRVFQRLGTLITSQEDVYKAINDYHYPLENWMLDVAETIINNDDIHVDDSNICDYRSLLLSLASLRINEQTDIHLRQYNYLQANGIISNLNIDQCLFLLHVWLLTLAAKDASIIITIKKLDDDVCSNTNNLHYDIPFKVLKSQCEDHAGIVSNLQNCPKYAYTIGVIDIDRKPVDKIWTKYDEEDNVCLQAAQAEMYLKKNDQKN